MLKYSETTNVQILNVDRKKNDHKYKKHNKEENQMNQWKWARWRQSGSLMFQQRNMEVILFHTD